MIETGDACSFYSEHLGIAQSSDAAMVADLRVCSRIMYTAGKAVVELNMLGDDVVIAYGIPLPAKGKNPFLAGDRIEVYILKWCVVKSLQS